MRLTVDASVFVSAMRPQEANHAASRRVLDLVERQSTPVRCPSLVLAECSGAIARVTGDTLLAAQVVALVRGFPGLRLLSLTPLLGERAAALAAAHRLRGADAVYAATAARSRSILITWDAEMLARAPAAVTTMTPSDWLAAQAISP